MNERDKTIRKQWLIMWGVSLLAGIVFSMSYGFLQMKYNPLLSNGISQVCYIAFLLLISFIWSFLCYYCIYKKPGTKLLTFSLIATALSFVINLFFYLTGRLSLQEPPLPYYKTSLLATQGLGVLWMIACWRMRKLNKKIQAQAIFPHYQ